MLGCLDSDCVGGAGDGDGFVGGDLGFVGLALAGYFAAGGVQLDTGFLVGLFGVAGFAVGKQADTSLDHVACVGPGHQVDVLACGHTGGGACVEAGGLGRDQGYACRGRHDDVGVSPCWGLACAAACDCLNGSVIIGFSRVGLSLCHAGVPVGIACCLLSIQ